LTATLHLQIVTENCLRAPILTATLLFRNFPDNLFIQIITHKHSVIVTYPSPSFLQINKFKITEANVISYSIARKKTIKLIQEYVILCHGKPLITYGILQIIPLPVLLLFCQSLY